MEGTSWGLQPSSADVVHFNTCQPALCKVAKSKYPEGALTENAGSRSWVGLHVGQGKIWVGESSGTPRSAPTGDDSRGLAQLLLGGRAGLGLQARRQHIRTTLSSPHSCPPRGTSWPPPAVVPSCSRQPQRMSFLAPALQEQRLPADRHPGMRLPAPVGPAPMRFAFLGD